MKLENSLRYVKLLPLQGALLTDIIPRALPWAKSFCPFRACVAKLQSLILRKSRWVFEKASSKYQANFEQTLSKHQASIKQPVSDLYPCGRIPQTAAPLLARPLMVRQPYSEAV